jgi:hypothetical protein
MLKDWLSNWKKSTSPIIEAMKLTEARSFTLMWSKAFRIKSLEKECPVENC